MQTNMIKQLLDACFIAKRITETMDVLPKGMKPRHIHVIDAIFEQENSSGKVCVSDVSKRLNVTNPSVTKLINDLEAMGIVRKYAEGKDKRVTLLSLTEKGYAYEQRYVTEYHTEWAQRLTDITDSQAQNAILVIQKLQKAMPVRSISRESSI